MGEEGPASARLVWAASGAPQAPQPWTELEGHREGGRGLLSCTASDVALRPGQKLSLFRSSSPALHAAVAPVAGGMFPAKGEPEEEATLGPRVGVPKLGLREEAGGLDSWLGVWILGLRTDACLNPWV